MSGAQQKTARERIASPSLAMLPRVADSLSFLYLDAVRVVQDKTGVCARVGTEGGGDRVYLPTAALSCVLLGPGTSITQPALATLARHGTTVVCAGSNGVRAYSGIQPSSLTTYWLEAQARCWADGEQRLAVATRMYRQRFGDQVPAGATLPQLRGIEGQRVKAQGGVLLGEVDRKTQAAGLATCPMEGFRERWVRRALGIPPSQLVVLVVPVGYPDDPTPRRTRLPLDGRVHRDRW